MPEPKKKISSFQTVRTFLREGTWSEAIMGVVDRSFDNGMKVEEKATMPLAGGIASMGYQCGMLWGAALAAGARAYQLHGPGHGSEAEAIVATQKLVETFRSQAKNEINCLEITELDMKKGSGILKFFLKGGPIGCFRMSARYAREAYDDLYSAFEKEPMEVASGPVSCVSLFAEKLDVSEQHVVMVAGLAGGIGLSGGGCGVLGAAIWLKGLNTPVEVEGISYAGTWVNEKVEEFLEISDYEFECEAIVGRKFKNVDDHADYLSSGGCAKLIEALAS